jgi:phospholipase/carboxylesterase
MARRLLARAPLLALLALTLSFGPAIAPSPVREVGPFRASWHTAAGLDYLLVEPSDVPPERPLPMIVYLHGRGATPVAPERSIFGLSQPVRLVMPRGPLRFAEGYAWMPVSAHRGESKPLLSALDACAAMLADAISIWRRTHHAEGAPVVVGFSQGAIVATHLAMTEPRAASRAIGLAGWYPPSRVPRHSNARAYPEIALLHGTQDAVLDAERTRAIAEQMRARGVPVTFEAFEGVGHEAPASMRARLRALIEDGMRASRPERAGDSS